jgi:CRP-like cAMP-binding protein
VHPDPDRLKAVDLFQSLDDSERATLASWLEVEELSADGPLLRADTSGYAFFVLDEGRARAELDGVVLEVLEPGAVFGEMAFFAPDGHRTATIVPETPLRVFSMFGTRFRQMQQELPTVAARLQQLVEKRAARVQAAKEQP